MKKSNIVIQEEYSGITRVKINLLNPINSLKDIFNIEMPSDNYIYLSRIYKIFNYMMDSICVWKNLHTSFDKLLSDNNISYNSLMQVDSVDNIITKARSYTNILEIIYEDLLSYHRKVIGMLKSIGGMTSVNLDNDFWTVISGACDQIRNEFIVYSSIDEDTIDKFSFMLNGIIVNMLTSLSSISKEEKLIDELKRDKNIEGGLFKMKVDKKKTSNVGLSDDGEFIPYEKDKIHINNSREKENNKDLKRCVNEFDKSWGVDLHDPVYAIDDEYEYDEYIRNVRILCAGLLAKVNLMSPSDFIISGDEIFMDDSVKYIRIDASFKRKSIWFRKTSGYTNSVAYGCRLLSYIIAWVCNNIEVAVDRCYECDDSLGFMEYESKTDYVQAIIEKLSDMTVNVLKGKGFGDNCMFFYELMLYANIRDYNDDMHDVEEIINNMHEKSSIVSGNIGIVGKKNDPESIDTLLKLAYMMCTNNSDVSGTVQFIPDLRRNDYIDIKKLLIELGHSVHENSDWCSPLFKMYITACPSLWSRWNDINSNQYLLLGYYAISYMAYVINDKRISKFVNSVLTA